MTPGYPYYTRVPARLVRAPVTLTDPYPHGGTALGRSIGAISLVCEDVRHPLRYEGLGEQPVAHLQGGRRWTLTAAFRGLDPDALAALGLTVVDTDVGGLDDLGLDRASEGGPVVNSIGREVSTYVLLVAPEQRMLSPGLIAYAAAPIIGSAQIVWRRGTDIAVAAQWELQIDASDRVFQVGLLDDLDL